MPTLHIEHAIVDFGLWCAAFQRFAQARTEAGVLGHRVQRPIDDDNFVMIDLEFDSIVKAEAFRRFLTDRVWSSPERSPALVGTPQTRILERAATD